MVLPEGQGTWTSKMTKTMHAILPIFSVLGILGHHFGHFGGPGIYSNTTWGFWGSQSARLWWAMVSTKKSSRLPTKWL